MGSSETTREVFIFNNDLFVVSLFWFMGFTEGDGSFLINKDG